MKSSLLSLSLIAGLLLTLGTRSRSQESEVTHKAFRISAESLSGLFSVESPGSAGASDPFAAPGNASPVVPISDLQAHLEEVLEIPFPEGTYVRHDEATGKLEIAHQPGVVAAIEAYLQALDQYGERQINIRAEIYQMPAKAALKVQQLCGPINDHSPILKQVAAMVEKNQASLVTTAAVIARSGQRARVKAVEEVIYPTEADWNEKEDALLPAAFETRDVGTIFEVDPVIGADDFTIDLNFSLEHHTAPPVMSPIETTSASSGRVVAMAMPTFHAKQITTQITTGNGLAKCISAWRPTGTAAFEQADLMQVAFLLTEIQVMRKLRPWED